MVFLQGASRVSMERDFATSAIGEIRLICQGLETLCLMSLTEHLQKLLAGGSLSKDEAADAADAIVDGAHACQAAALLALLKRKGETADEIAGFVLAMRRRDPPPAP